MCNRNNLFLTFLSLFVAQFAWATTPRQSHAEYIEKYKAIAIKEMERSSIPASITIAQGILESDAGNSELAIKGNNHFGIKCGSTRDWNGDTFYKKDDDRNQNGEIEPSCFRKYASAEESFIAHSDFLHHPNKPWYLPLFELKITDYKGWAYGLYHAKYATNPDYPALLIDLIQRYQLNQLDTQATAPSIVPPAPAEIVATPAISRINQLKCTTATEGETVYSIAKRTNTSTRQLIKYNDNIRYSHQYLRRGQIVFLQQKKSSNRNTPGGYHTVKEGDTMESISQQYGIRLFWLYFKNKMVEGMEPAIGSNIQLDGRGVVKRPAIKGINKDTQSSKPSKSEGFIIWKDAPSPKKAQTPVVDFPEETSKVRTHIVSKGETLWSISRTYKIPVKKLKSLNQLSDTVLGIGQEVILE